MKVLIPTTSPEASTAVAGIDGCVRLHVDERAVLGDLSGDGAHHPHRHRVPQTVRTSECEHQLALADAIVVRESEHGNVVRINLQEREVELV